MNILRWTALAVMAFSFALYAELDTQKISLIGTTDRKPVEYACGEEMTFTITADFGDQDAPGDYIIKWERTGDDGKKQEGRDKIDEKHSITVKTSLDCPGFVRIQATLLDQDGQPVQKITKIWNNEAKRDIQFEGGAGADIAKIAQATAEPEDFDAFWSKQKAKLAAVPLKYTMDKIKTENGIDTYAVTVDSPGPRPVTGYLTIPADAAPKSLPARVMFHGYSVPNQKPHNGSPKEIQFNVNAHGYELGHDDAYYKEYAETIKSNGHGYAFDPAQNSDPEASYFNGMALRVMRSLEFVKSLPQWDGKHLIASGGSQGGLQSSWAGGLDRDVTKVVSNITWCCDMSAHKVIGRLKGWHPAWVDALGYYDAVNHARRIECPVEIERAGLGDYTCPPSGLAVFYNNISAPKKIRWAQGSTHGYTPPKAEWTVQQSESF